MTLEAGFRLLCMKDYSVLIQDTGAVANQARFKFGHGRMGDMRFVADITVGIAASTGNFTAFISAANIPALQRKGGMGGPCR